MDGAPLNLSSSMETLINGNMDRIPSRVEMNCGFIRKCFLEVLTGMECKEKMLNAVQESVIISLEGFNSVGELAGALLKQVEEKEKRFYSFQEKTLKALDKRKEMLALSQKELDEQMKRMEEVIVKIQLENKQFQATQKSDLEKFKQNFMNEFMCEVNNRLNDLNEKGRNLERLKVVNELKEQVLDLKEEEIKAREEELQARERRMDLQQKQLEAWERILDLHKKQLEVPDSAEKRTEQRFLGQTLATSHDTGAEDMVIQENNASLSASHTYSHVEGLEDQNPNALASANTNNEANVLDMVIEENGGGADVEHSRPLVEGLQNGDPTDMNSELGIPGDKLRVNFNISLRKKRSSRMKKQTMKRP